MQPIVVLQISILKVTTTLLTTTNRCTNIVYMRVRKTNRLHPNAIKGSQAKLPNIHSFNQPQNQVPPGIAAGSQTCNAQASEDDLDDLPSLKKLVI